MRKKKIKERESVRYSFTLEFAHETKLGGAEVAEVSGADAIEDINDVSLKEEGRLGVDEVEDGGGAPASDPVEGALKGGGPWRQEHAERISLHLLPFFYKVFLVLFHDPFHGFLSVFILQILHHDLQLHEPKSVKVGERSDHGNTFGFVRVWLW